MEDPLQSAKPELLRKLLEQHEKKREYQREYRMRNKEYYARKQRERRQQNKQSGESPETQDADISA